MLRTAKIRIFVFLLGLTCVLSGVMELAQATPQPFVIIVHPDNETGALERKFLEDAFLKKTTRWSNGKVIRPVDLRPESPVRIRFSDVVLRRSVASVRSYWQQIIFSGRDVPPPELESEEAVVSYVLRHSGSVGYVSSTAKIGSAKIVSVQ